MAKRMSSPKDKVKRISRTEASIPDIVKGKLIYKTIKHDALLPCPFCGSDNVEATVESSSAYHVHCWRCGARSKPMELPAYWDCDRYGDVEDHLIKKAVEAWNKRA